MSNYIFLFDMDSTITRKEVLPEVSKRIGKLDEMRCKCVEVVKRDKYLEDVRESFIMLTSESGIPYIFAAY